MITKVVLAKLSPTMEEGTVVSWNKQEGDAVKVGDVLAEIETDKANMEMEALGTGVLRRILVQAGEKAPVGQLIGVIAEPDEDISALLAEAEAAAPAGSPEPDSSGSPPAPRPAAEPTAPSPAPAAAETQAPRAGSVVSFPDGGGRIKSSPLARAIAASRNVPLEDIAGSGPGGRIIKRDVEGYLSAPVPRPGRGASRAPAGRADTPTVVPGTEITLSNMRRTIARRLSESKFTAPHFYVTMDVAMDRAVAVREQILEAEEVKISYNDLVVKAAAKALARFPTVNASWAEDRIVTHAGVHVGVAVALPDGLITPVVRDADQKTVGDISQEIKELAGRAREKKLKPDEYTGSTFTVSNLGMLDVTEFTAIINPPESCILAVGAIRKEPVVVDDEIQVGQRMKLTLSSDHRVVDGALAARFLGEIRRLLENPIGLLL